MDKSAKRSLEDASKECEPTALTTQNFWTGNLYLNTFYIGPFVSFACGIEVRRQEQYKLLTAMQQVGYRATLLVPARRLGELAEARPLPIVDLSPHLLDCGTECRS